VRSRERDLLARLTHPNIAQLHDGGVSDAGSPYFTLEHVEGQAITAWCDARARGITARVKLLLKVCEAVQFAHRNLIVHRDLNTRRSRGPEPRVVHPGHDAVSHGSLRGSRERIAPRRQRGARKSRRPSDHGHGPE
jgi:serine/threonine protein kinase